MRIRYLAGTAVGLVLAIAAGATNAAIMSGSFQFYVSTANQGGDPFEAASPFTGFHGSDAITATFTYNGPLQFNVGPPQNSNNTGDLNSDFFGAHAAGIQNYVGFPVPLPPPAGADFFSLTTFLASSGSASGFQYGSLYRINLGFLPTGTLLSITHDDGVSVYVDGVRTGATNAGPTVEITEQVLLTAGGDTLLFFGRQNGSPSVLTVDAIIPTPVPEPASLALLGAGLAGLGLLARRRRA